MIFANVSSKEYFTDILNILHNASENSEHHLLDKMAISESVAFQKLEESPNRLRLVREYRFLVPVDEVLSALESDGLVKKYRSGTHTLYTITDEGAIMTRSPKRFELYWRLKQRKANAPQKS